MNINSDGQWFVMLPLAIGYLYLLGLFFFMFEKRKPISQYARHITIVTTKMLSFIVTVSGFVVLAVGGDLIVFAIPKLVGTSMVVTGISIGNLSGVLSRYVKKEATAEHRAL